MSNHNNHHKKSVNVERRTWDVAAYEEKAIARQQQQQQQDSHSNNNDNSSSNHVSDQYPTGSSSNNNADDANMIMTIPQKEEFIVAPKGSIGPEGSQRAYLQARKRKVVDIDERIGSTKMLSIDDAVGTKKQNNSIVHDNTQNSIGTTVTSKNGGDTTITIKITDGIKSSGIGFHCRVCDCYLKDSLTYFDHINGRKHQRNLGYTMRVERSSEMDVLQKLKELTNEQEKKTNDSHHTTNYNGTDVNVDYDKIVQEKDMDEARQREERQRFRKERRKQRHHNHHHHDYDESPNVPPEETILLMANNDNDNNNKVEKDEITKDHDNDDEEEEPMIDPAMAAMMGFTGFGGR